MCQDECTALLVRTTHIVEMLQARVTALQQVQPTGLFAMLQVTTLVRLVTDLVDEDDSLCVALTCRQLRDAVLSRFPPKLEPKARISTRRLASAVSMSRVVWAQSMGCDLHDLVDLTARTGQVEVLEWALARGYSWPSDACVTAADEGHFDVLELARKTGGPWRGPNDRGLPDGEMVMRGLAQHGQVALLKQYIEAGCEVSSFVWNSAASAGQLDVLDYLIEIQEEKGHSKGTSKITILPSLFCNQSCGHKQVDMLSLLLGRSRPGRQLVKVFSASLVRIVRDDTSQLVAAPRAKRIASMDVSLDMLPW